MFWGSFLAISVLVYIEERKCFKRIVDNIYENLSLKTTKNIRPHLLEMFFNEKDDISQVFYFYFLYQTIQCNALFKHNA